MNTVDICDCGHSYLSHRMHLLQGVLTGGLECDTNMCACGGFHNETTRAIAARRSATGDA